MNQKVLLTEKKGEFFEITLNRPECLNALNNELMDLLLLALNDFETDLNSRVCIIHGAGKHFSSGADIKQFADPASQTPEAIKHRGDTAFKIHRALHSICKPIISSVRGYALAGGCGLALGCDFVIASENSVFGYVEAKRNIVPAIVMPNLSKIIGRRKALEYLMTGKKISAYEAFQAGMINYVVPDDKLESRTWELAEELAHLNPHTLGTIKKLFYKVVEVDFESGLQIGRDGHIEMRKTNEFAQGVIDYKK